MPTTPTDPPLTLASPANSTTLVTAETLIIPAPFPAYSTPRVETPASQEVQDVQRPLVTQYPTLYVVSRCACQVPSLCSEYGTLTCKVQQSSLCRQH